MLNYMLKTVLMSKPYSSQIYIYIYIYKLSLNTTQETLQQARNVTVPDQVSK